MGQSVDECMFYGFVIDEEAYTEWLDAFDFDEDWADPLWVASKEVEDIHIEILGYPEYGYCPVGVAYAPSMIRSLQTYKKIDDPRETLFYVSTNRAQYRINAFLEATNLPTPPDEAFGWFLGGSYG